jgi:hypothetical protein
VDVYTVDHYENGAADGKDYATTARKDLWLNWLGCVNGAGAPMKPIGFGENGFDMNGSTAVSDATSVATLNADNTYLSQYPETGQGTTAPATSVFLWDWWDNGNSDLEGYSDVPPLWRSFETANGGGVNP